MTFQEEYDEAMFEFSQGNYQKAVAGFQSILGRDPSHFDARLSVGMAFYRLGDYAQAIAEGHRAEALRPKDQLVHTNLSLFYMKSGDKAAAERHGLQARIAGWREDPEARQVTEADPDLKMANPKRPSVPPPEAFPDMPWKRKAKPGDGRIS